MSKVVDWETLPVGWAGPVCDRCGYPGYAYSLKYTRCSVCKLADEFNSGEPIDDAEDMLQDIPSYLAEIIRHRIYRRKNL